MASSAVHQLLYGGARSTKTFLLCYATLIRAEAASGSRHLIGRLHHVDVRKSVMMDTWPKMMRLAAPGRSYRENKQDQYIVLPNDSEVWFGGLDDKDRVEKVLGLEYATIYLNEVSQIAYDTVLTLRTRLAQNVVIDSPKHPRKGDRLPIRAYYDLNPVGRSHWSYREFVELKDPVTGLPLKDPSSRRHAVMNPADNPHLPPETLAEYAALPERQRQRYYEGKYLSEVPGALWPLDRIERSRVETAPPLERIVVANDPSGSDGVGGDKQGIIAVGLGIDGRGYVLADASCRLPPNGWARVTVDLYHTLGADLIVAEANFGGAMVETTIRTADANVPVKLVHASRGKHIRAEPVAALYEQGKVSHVGVFRDLEDQMGLMTTQGYQGGDSPDRVDALVWALTELMVGDGGHKFAFA